ncbi:hypothetical protein [Methanobrevibacter sp. YE315]|uniref:hypothetical protein n=1 Tax=Methanobrevibacter sp. YE315 TaxID=1609968 RepID=UPI000ABDBD95|nr:hypothetical protein [Methanobrevibacter sp. YE315]
MNEIPIIRTTFPYLTVNEMEFMQNLEKELKEKNMTHEDMVKEIFSEIGVKIDLNDMS